MNFKVPESVTRVLPAAICATTSLLLYFKIRSVEEKQDQILDEIEDIKQSITGEALANAILEATQCLKDKKDKKKDKKDKKDKKGKKDKKDKKKKDKKKKDKKKK